MGRCGEIGSPPVSPSLLPHSAKNLLLSNMTDAGSAECRATVSSADKTTSVDLRDCTLPSFDQYALIPANDVDPSAVMTLIGSVPQQVQQLSAPTTVPSNNWMLHPTQQPVQVPYWAMNQTPPQLSKDAFEYMMHMLPLGSLSDNQQLGKWWKPCNFCMPPKNQSATTLCLHVAQKGPSGKITPSASTPTMTVHHRRSLPELPQSSSSTSSSLLRRRRRTEGNIATVQEQDEEQKRKNFLERNRQGDTRDCNALQS